MGNSTANSAAPTDSDTSVSSEPKYQLEASLPDWCILNWRHLIVCLVFSALFVVLNYMPLAVSSTWHDSWTGSWIASNGLYNADPSLPLAEGIRHHVDGWAGRIAIHWIHQTGGLEILSLVFASLYSVIAIIWASQYVRTSGRLWPSLFAIALMAICLPQLHGLSTRTFGALCFALLVALSLGANGKAKQDSGNQFEISLANIPWWKWLAIAVIAIAWANLDASFVVGWIWVVALFLSRLFTLVRAKFTQAKDISIWADRELKTRLILAQVVILAAICNPTGYKLFSSMLWWPDHPFAQAMATLKPMALFSFQGAGLAAAMLLWFFASRHATNVRLWQLFTVVICVVAVSWSASFLIWTLPLIFLATSSMLPQAESTLDDGMDAESAQASGGEASDEAQSPKALQFAFTLMCALIVWVSFSFSPASHLVLGGKSRTEAQILGVSHPIAAAKAIRTNEDKDGLLWCPSYWADSVQDFDEPRPVFANVNAQTLPEQALFDYEILYNGDSGWKKVLDRYGITEMMIDKQRQTRMLHNLRAKSQGWQRVHEDEKAVVFRKSNPNAN